MTYKQCKLNLRKEKIQYKNPHKWTLRRELENLYNVLQLDMNIIDFAHVTSLFLSNSDETLKSEALSNSRNWISWVLSNFLNTTLQK